MIRTASRICVSTRSEIRGYDQPCAVCQGGSAKLLYVYVDFEPVIFNRGFYTVDMRIFYAVTLQAHLGTLAPTTVEGLCVFDKRAILFGSEGNAKIFSSELRTGEPDIPFMRRSNLPVAVVETVDPIVLDARIVDCCGKRDCDCDLCEVPSFVNSCFDGELSSGDDVRRVYVTLGQFSIVRLERDSQLLVPVYDYCMPDKECSCGSGCEDPSASSATSRSLWGSSSRPIPCACRKTTKDEVLLQTAVNEPEPAGSNPRRLNLWGAECVNFLPGASA